jgi:hypothetical protein
MSSMAIEGYRSVNVTNPRKGYQEPSTLTTPIFCHKNSHYVRPNRVALKYPDFKKDVDLDAHVKMFNSVVKTNAKTFEICIINAFNYTPKDTTSN